MHHPMKPSSPFWTSWLLQNIKRIIDIEININVKTRNVSETSMPPMVQNSGFSSL